MAVNFYEVGKRIVQRRSVLALTQEQLAEKSGISATFIGNIERANSKCSIETLMKICSSLGVTPDYLLLGVNKEAGGDIFEEMKIEVLRCDKKKQRMILSYIKWFSEQST